MNNDTDTARLRKLDQDQDHHLHPFTNLSKHSQQGGRTISPAHDVGGLDQVEQDSGIAEAGLSDHGIAAP